MYMKSLLLAVALAAAAVNAKDSIKVVFKKYTSDDCSGHVVGDEHDIKSGDCKSFDHDFSSYLANRDMGMFNYFHHNFNSPNCQVIVYEQVDCRGGGESMGQFLDGIGECGHVGSVIGGGIKGRSASVTCHADMPAQTGYYPPGGPKKEGDMVGDGSSPIVANGGALNAAIEADKNAAWSEVGEKFRA